MKATKRGEDRDRTAAPLIPLTVATALVGNRSAGKVRAMVDHAA